MLFIILLLLLFILLLAGICISYGKEDNVGDFIIEMILLTALFTCGVFVGDHFHGDR